MARIGRPSRAEVAIRRRRVAQLAAELMLVREDLIAQIAERLHVGEMAIRGDLLAIAAGDMPAPVGGTGIRHEITTALAGIDDAEALWAVERRVASAIAAAEIGASDGQLLLAACRELRQTLKVRSQHKTGSASLGDAAMEHAFDKGPAEAISRAPLLDRAPPFMQEPPHSVSDAPREP